jgi:2'-5' RNA ligase
MRLFAAVPIPSPAQEVIAGVLQRLRSAGLPVRWVNDDGLHLTLKFYGEVPAERREVIEESLRMAARGTGPLPLRLGELGAFPSPRHPKVLWVGLEAPPALELLQDRLERGGEAIGFPPEGRPFRPHVTLGRVREGHRVPLEVFDPARMPLAPMAFLADRVVLYESVLTPAGPEYRAHLTLTLAH